MPGGQSQGQCQAGGILWDTGAALKLYQSSFFERTHIKALKNVHNLRGGGIYISTNFLYDGMTVEKKQVMTQIQTHFLFHRLCHVSLPAPSRTPCCFYPRCVHVFTSAFPFSSPLWRLVFAARNYPENVLKRCPTSLHILWRTFIDRRHFSWRTSRLPRRWTLHPSSYSSLPTLRSLYGWQGLKYKYTHYLPLNHLCAPLPSSQHPNLLKWLTSWWELAAPTDSVPTLSELPLRYPDIPPLPEGLGVSRILIRGPWCKQIIYNIPEINRAKEKSCFHLVLRSIFFEPITLPLQYHAFQMCLLITCVRIFCRPLPLFFITHNYITFTFGARILLNGVWGVVL